MPAGSAGETIRPATAADIDAIVAIERVAFSDPPWSRSSFVRLLKDPYVQFLVAEAADPLGGPPAAATVVGYVVTYVVVDEADISNLAVSPECRGRGVGRRLLEAAIAGVESVGVRTVYLEVRESNTVALRLYDSRGFGVVGRRSAYYRHPAEDALILRLTLPKLGQARPHAAR